MKKLVLIVTSLFFICSTVNAAGTKANVITKGEDGEVSTIVGNGSAGQTSTLLDHPRHVEVNGKNILFVDGTHFTAKLRMYNGKSISTIVDLAKSPLVKRDKYFVSTGLAAINKEIYITNNNLFYKVVDKRITAIDKVNTYLKLHKLEYLYRMERYKDWIYIMYTLKNQTYSFIRYKPSDGTIEPVLDDVWINDPHSFSVQEGGILLAGAGTIQYEKFFPRETMPVIDTNEGTIFDAWDTASGQTIYSMSQGAYGRIYTTPRDNDDADTISILAGGVRGYTDGIADEVEMDHPKDFIWDGSGYLFADIDNSVIRKLWLNDPPAK